jgi:hypothetical protein
LTSLLPTKTNVKYSPKYGYDCVFLFFCYALTLLTLAQERLRLVLAGFHDNDLSAVKPGRQNRTLSIRRDEKARFMRGENKDFTHSGSIEQKLLEVCGGLFWKEAKYFRHQACARPDDLSDKGRGQLDPLHDLAHRVFNKIYNIF